MAAHSAIHMLDKLSLRHLRSCFNPWIFTIPLLVLGCSGVPELIVGDGGDADGTGSDGTNPNDDGGVIVDGDGSGDADGSTDGGATPADCGNGELESTELCDDGNEKDGDGCSKKCDEVDPDYLCATPGEKCVRVVTCGNGILEGSEACDDGLTVSGDGCSSDCDEVEAGYSCVRPGSPCSLTPVCGNGLRERGEGCDDAQSPSESNDGCSDECQLEDPSAWFCSSGVACVARACGNGVRTDDEACEVSIVGEGCTAQCEVADGYRCSSISCKPICGDGKVVGNEECDDGDGDPAVLERASGDGCSAACKEEPFFDCNSAEPSVCTDTRVCGDGDIDPGEVCDTGAGPNPEGCVLTGANRCKGYDTGLVDVAVCGNGVLELGEACDGDGLPGVDACLGNCSVVADGYQCLGANYCVFVPQCGDGLVQPGEQCDTGPATQGCDGCQVATGYYCSGQGPGSCVASACGDGVRAPDEACDDGPGAAAALNGDGCSTLCAVEPGWVCPPTGCQPRCGDGVVTPPEECEASSGCTNCKINSGYDCAGAAGTADDGLVCVLARCGNGVKERGEGCDNDTVAVAQAPIAGDGCGATCQTEPAVNHATTPPTVAQTCGDGVKTLSEACDDGNATSGDGCNSTCTLVESGWACDPVITYPGSIKFKITYRDFKHRNEVGGHPQMRQQGTNYPTTGLDLGIVGRVCMNDAIACGLLDSEGKPQYDSSVTNNTIDHASDGLSATYHTNAFKLWYRDTNPLNYKDASGSNDIVIAANPAPVPTGGDTIELTRQGVTSAYQFSAASNNFYPLGWSPTIAARGFGFTPNTSGSGSRNWNWTSELRYFFQYQGGETLTFFGDDDVWVFINGKLAVDIGGIHGTEWGRVILGDDGDGGGTDSNCSVHGGAGTPAACSLTGTEGNLADTDDKRFGLTKGSVYEIVVFQAERHPTGSNYRLTLDGFLAPRSSCHTTCGDGIRAGTELCDLGSNPTTGNANDIYGRCNTSCSYGFCGDGVEQTTNGGAEECDNGINSDIYLSGSGGSNPCAPGCVDPGQCGGESPPVLQPSFEVCDDGVNNGGYGECAAGCQSFQGYCGDGSVSGPESCDDSVKVGYRADGNGCGYDCQQAPFCGDGIRNGTENCDGDDDGDNNNNVDRCSANCDFVPTCGDGVKGSSEECDYGPFASTGDPEDAPYLGCTDQCLNGPFCGDGVLASAYEDCDDPAGNVAESVYDPAGKCTVSCVIGPSCGDGVENGPEACDNGFNDDTYAYDTQSGVAFDDTESCGASCADVPYCGDDIVQPGIEDCDDGDASLAGDGNQNNDTAYNGCKTNCTFGPYCGDGGPGTEDEDDGEACDDGPDNTAYGAGKCGYDCKPAPFCGDNVRNGAEECDDPKGNDGKYGGCTSVCKKAPYCGDKKTAAGKEACDDGPSGSLTCTPTCTARSDVK